MISAPRCAVFALWFLLAGCGRDQATPPNTVQQPTTPSPTLTASIDAWMGAWHGPEGTRLDIAADLDGYTLTIHNLDGARTFSGKATAGAITFKRDGVAETIRSTTGPQTGMKWLAEKQNCLTVRAGEGYCRD